MEVISSCGRISLNGSFGEEGSYFCEDLLLLILLELGNKLFKVESCFVACSCHCRNIQWL
jgi:hypothetical protein